jgi:hypothetical protein
MNSWTDPQYHPLHDIVENEMKFRTADGRRSAEDGEIMHSTSLWGSADSGLYPDDAANASNAASVNLDQSARIR